MSEKAKQYRLHKKLVRQPGVFCRFCIRTSKLEACHVKPRAWGGKFIVSNFIVLCRSCHISFDRFVGVLR